MDMLFFRRNSKFGVRLRMLRLEQGWSQQVLAEKIGRSVASVCGYEQGFHIPEEEALQKMAEVFGISKEALAKRSS